MFYHCSAPCENVGVPCFHTMCAFIAIRVLLDPSLDESPPLDYQVRTKLLKGVFPRPQDVADPSVPDVQNRYEIIVAPGPYGCDVSLYRNDEPYHLYACGWHDTEIPSGLVPFVDRGNRRDLRISALKKLLQNGSRVPVRIRHDGTLYPVTWDGKRNTRSVLRIDIEEESVKSCSGLPERDLVPLGNELAADLKAKTLFPVESRPGDTAARAVRELFFQKNMWTGDGGLGGIPIVGRYFPVRMEIPLGNARYYDGALVTVDGKNYPPVESDKLLPVEWSVDAREQDPDHVQIDIRGRSNGRVITPAGMFRFIDGKGLPQSLRTKKRGHAFRKTFFDVLSISDPAEKTEAAKAAMSSCCDECVITTSEAVSKLTDLVGELHRQEVLFRSIATKGQRCSFAIYKNNLKYLRLWSIYSSIT